MSENIANPLVSIVIPVYNSANTLNRCLDSIISQTYDNIEIVIVNDGSTDNSQDILLNYGLKDSRVKIINQENASASIARNNGISKTTGKYLMFVDSDDYLELNAVELLVHKAEKNGCQAVVFAHKKIYPEKTDLFIFPWDDSQIYSGEFSIRKILNYKIKGYICDKFFLRKKWLELHLTFEKGRYCEDLYPISKYLFNSNSVGFINQCIYNYVQIDSSSIHTSNIKVIKDYNYAINKVLSIFTDDCNKYRSDIKYFKAIAFSETIHELYNVSIRAKRSIYFLYRKNLKEYKIPGWSCIFNKNIPTKTKISLLLWKLRLYSIFKFISKK